MRIAVFAAALLAGSVVSMSASTNWQFTKWGMTDKQVLAASKGAAVTLSEEQSAEHSSADRTAIAKLSMPYSTGSYKFTAFFNFKKEKLAFVTLDLDEGNPHEVIGALRGRYGKPVNENTNDRILNAWRWLAGTDSVEAFMIGEKLSASYAPRHQENEKGL